jgi:hypothetical protein
MLWVALLSLSCGWVSLAILGGDGRPDRRPQRTAGIVLGKR